MTATLSVGKLMDFMRTGLWLVATLVALCLCDVCAKEAVEELSWKELLPEPDVETSDLDALSAKQRFQLSIIAGAEQMKSSAGDKLLRRTVEKISAQANKFRRELEAANIDVAALLPQLEGGVEKELKRRRSVDRSFDGQRVRIKGYFLPLRENGEGRREFLLVPFVGACIHVPPPPPNQIIHVNLQKSFELQETFAAVTVTGTLHARDGRRRLSYVDGAADIYFGYVMVNASVQLREDTGMPIAKRGFVPPTSPH